MKYLVELIKYRKRKSCLTVNASLAIKIMHNRLFKVLVLIKIPNEILEVNI